MVPYHPSPSDPVQHFDHFRLLSFSHLHPVSLQVHSLWSLDPSFPFYYHAQSLIIPLWNITVIPKLTSVVCLLSLQPILYISAQLFSKREVYHFSPAQKPKMNNFFKSPNFLMTFKTLLPLLSAYLGGLITFHTPPLPSLSLHMYAFSPDLSWPPSIPSVWWNPNNPSRPSSNTPPFMERCSSTRQNQSLLPALVTFCLYHYILVLSQVPRRRSWEEGL